MFGTWDVELLVEFCGGVDGLTTVGPIMVGEVVVVGDVEFDVTGDVVIGVLGDTTVGDGAEDNPGTDALVGLAADVGVDTDCGWVTA
ncbi:hypothetical protein AGMMS50267_00570 [Spirochaetia bacterium]|nr:hypothetical protein AGMMS50267_00570 [Spirochaetia bacterium]